MRNKNTKTCECMSERNTVTMDECFWIKAPQWCAWKKRKKKYKQGWSVDVMFSSLTGPCVKSRCITSTFQQTPQWTDHCVYTNSACLVSLFLCTEVLNCHNHWITCPIPACRTDQRQCRKSSLLLTTFIGWNNLPVPVELAGCFHLCWMFQFCLSKS